MDWRRKIWWAGGLVVALLAVYVGGMELGWFPGIERVIQPAALYHIASAEGVWPRFVEAEIDPLKVSVGSTQRMRIVLENNEEITEVKAIIKTDNQTLEVPLTLTERRGVTRADVEKKKYVVEDSKLVVVDRSARDWSSLVERLVESASAVELQRFEYEGAWVVHDTHDEVYHTTFEARDAKERVNSITLAWSDPCSPPLGDNWIVEENQTCDISPTGPDNGNIIINLGFTLTVGTTTVPAVTVVWGPGKTITVNGQIAIQNGSQLTQARIYVGPDADNDGYMPIGQSFARSLSSQAGYLLGASSVSAASTSLISNDCYDADPATTNAELAYPGQTNYYYTNRGDNSFDYNCSGSSEGGWKTTSSTGPAVYAQISSEGQFPYTCFTYTFNSVSDICGQTSVAANPCGIAKIDAPLKLAENNFHLSDLLNLFKRAEARPSDPSYPRGWFAGETCDTTTCGTFNTQTLYNLCR